MSKEDWKDNPVHKNLSDYGLWNWNKGDIISVLDVGCGLSLRGQYIDPSFVMGVDIFEPYLKAIQSKVPYSVIKMDVRKIGKVFIDNSFDIVCAFDIIEHLKKRDSEILIENCIKIAKKAVLIETPKGYIPQNIDIQNFGGHKYQTHRSGWSVEELEKIGFNCIVRKYVMQNVRRHTKLHVDPNIELIDAIFVKK